MSDGALDPTVPVTGTASTRLDAGTRIGRFEIEGVLGEGGMGIVYAARDPRLGRTVAIKIVRGGERSTSGRSQLLAEARAMAKISHASVVPVFDVGELGDDVYVAMEHVPGGTLADWLAERPRTWREVTTMLIAVGRGLAAAHAAGIVHRDFKPANVLLGADAHPRVSDFGLAEVDDRADRSTGDLTTTASTIAGTPAYMSPEQHRGRSVDARSDQFAFCVTAWEALYGERPFRPLDLRHAETVAALAAAVVAGRIEPPPANDVPRRVQLALRRGLSVDPDARWPSMAALLDELARIARPRSRGWVIAAIAVAAVASIATFLLVPRGAERAGAPACDDDPAIDAAWNDTRRQAYRERFARESWLEQEVGWIDDFATRLRAARRDVCRDEGRDPRARLCIDEAVQALERAAQKTNAFWPMLPSLADCLGDKPRIEVLAPRWRSHDRKTMSPAGDQIASSSFGDAAEVLTLRSTEITTIAGGWHLADWTQDGRFIVESADGRLTVHGHDEVSLPPREPRDIAMPVRQSLDGDWLAIGGVDRTRIWSHKERRFVREIEGRTHAVAWEPIRGRLAITSSVASGPTARLHIIDVQRGRVVDVPLRLVNPGVGHFGVAWLAPGRLAMNGSSDVNQGAALWTLDIDDVSQIRGTPTVRITAPIDHAFTIEHGSRGRVLAQLYSLSVQLRRWSRASGEQVLPHQLRGLTVDVDLRRGLGLVTVRRGGQRFFTMFDLQTWKPMIEATPFDYRTPMPTARVTLWQGQPHVVRHVGDSTWAIVRLDADGSEHERARFEWPSRCGPTPSLDCNDANPDACRIASLVAPTCVAGWANGQLSRPISLLERDSIKAPLSHDEVLVLRFPVTVAVADFMTGKTRELFRAEQPCTVNNAAAGSDGNGFYISLTCPDGFRVVHTKGGARESTIVKADGWISDFAPLRDGSLLYTVMEYDARLHIVDGL